MSAPNVSALGRAMAMPGLMPFFGRKKKQPAKDETTKQQKTNQGQTVLTGPRENRTFLTRGM